MPNVDYFLKLSGIKGGSRDSKHKDEIELVSFAWGVAAPAGGGPGGGAGAGRAGFTGLRVTAPVSVASPALFLTCASGQHIKDGLLTVRSAAGRHGAEFLKFKLYDVLVTAYDEAGSENDVEPLEAVTFDVGKFEITFVPAKADGSGGSPVSSGWDFKKNTKF
jgi:type VI secretion system secreted protein Hcp